MYRHHQVYEALFCQILVGEAKVCLMSVDKVRWNT